MILLQYDSDNLPYENDYPFDIPDNWLWLKHNDLFEISGGSQPPKSKFVERFPELSLFFKAYSPLDSEMICIFPYFCPYAESAREIREIFS